jgi:hypothetical protein
MRAKRTAEANFSGSPAKPGARISISHGMTISPRRVKATSTTASPDSAWPAKARAPSGSAWRRLAKSGMKAASNAPSANSRRNMFGMRNATKNASATGEAPSTAAIRTSRTKPSTRLAMVIVPTVATPR